MLTTLLNISIFPQSEYDSLQQSCMFHRGETSLTLSLAREKRQEKSLEMGRKICFYASMGRNVAANSFEVLCDAAAQYISVKCTCLSYIRKKDFTSVLCSFVCHALGTPT